MKFPFLDLRVRLAQALVPERRKLFLVVKFGGKTYLKMTEDELRLEIAKTGGVGVRLRDRTLMVEAYELDPKAPRL